MSTKIANNSNDIKTYLCLHYNTVFFLLYWLSNYTTTQVYILILISDENRNTTISKAIRFAWDRSS